MKQIIRQAVLPGRLCFTYLQHAIATTCHLNAAQLLLYAYQVSEDETCTQVRCQQQRMDGCKLANKASLTTSTESLLRSVERNRQYQGAGARQMVTLCRGNRTSEQEFFFLFFYECSIIKGGVKEGACCLMCRFLLAVVGEM